MINVLLWTGGIIVAMLIIVWISARANRMRVVDYFRLYGGELLILLMVSTVMIVPMVADIG